jgi:hypothetical protein
LLTATAGIVGLRGRSSRSGVPQIVVQMPQWTSTPGLMPITPIAPISSNCATRPGLAKPSEITILPRTRSASSVVVSIFCSNMSVIMALWRAPT